MSNFDNWLTVTDPRLMTEALAAQFRLSQQELQKASDALAPAFALGIQRAVADPTAWTELSRAFMTMAPIGFGTPQQASAGPAFLEAFFRSEPLISAIARQASLVAGIAPDTMQKLMPGLALMSMDHSMRTTMDTLLRNQPAGLATGDFGGAAAEMMRRGANAVEAMSRPSDAPIGKQPQPGNPFAGNPMADAFSDAMKASLNWFTPPAKPAEPAAKTRPAKGGTERKSASATDAGPGSKEPDAFNPLLPMAMMMEAFAKGVASKAVPASVPQSPQGDTTAEAPASGEAGPSAPSSVNDAFVKDVMRSGQKIQEDYAREMAALFERYLGEAKAGG